MATAFVLNAREKQLLQETINTVRGLYLGQVKDTSIDSTQAPEIYIARPVDEDGIPATYLNPGSPATRVDPRVPPQYLAGVAECDIYRIINTIRGSELQQTSIHPKTVHNLSESPIEQGFIVIHKEKFGRYVVDCPCEVTLTGTGTTGTGTGTGTTGTGSETGTSSSTSSEPTGTSSSTSSEDTGTSSEDTGTSTEDSGTGTSTEDSGTSTEDSGTSTEDSGTSSEDSGTGTGDTGTGDTGTGDTGTGGTGSSGTGTDGTGTDTGTGTTTGTGTEDTGTGATGTGTEDTGTGTEDTGTGSSSGSPCIEINGIDFASLTVVTDPDFILGIKDGCLVKVLVTECPIDTGTAS